MNVRREPRSRSANILTPCDPPAIRVVLSAAAQRPKFDASIERPLVAVVFGPTHPKRSRRTSRERVVHRGCPLRSSAPRLRSDPHDAYFGQPVGSGIPQSRSTAVSHSACRAAQSPAPFSLHRRTELSQCDRHSHRATTMVLVTGTTAHRRIERISPFQIDDACEDGRRQSLKEHHFRECVGQSNGRQTDASEPTFRGIGR